MDRQVTAFVVVPAYNEAHILHHTLSSLVGAGYRVVAVDDGSTDDTSSLALTFPVHVLRHVTNLGQGAALQTGIAYALSFPECTHIVTFDADGQHRVEDIAALISAMQESGADVAIGSRFKDGTRAPGIPLTRIMVLRLAAFFTRLTTGLRVTDAHNGLRAFTRFAAGRVRIRQAGMAHASEIIGQIRRAGLTYIEVPVTIDYTAYSRSKGQRLWNGLGILWETLVGGLAGDAD